MKISFYTLGCPGWAWEDIAVTAKDLGFNGIEIRGIRRELYAPNAKPFIDAEVQNTKERLDRLNLEIPCLTSSCCLYDKPGMDLKEGRDYIDLAGKLGTPFIRVLGDISPEPSKEVNPDYVKENLRILGGYAKDKDVKVLIETNGFFSNSKNMLDLLEKVRDDNIGVLWDIHHPFRFFGEPVEETYNALKEYIEFIHLKDSCIEDGKVRYKMMGSGDIPVKSALKLLKDNGYEGYVSLEWVKRWNMDLEEPGIVFSHFINYVRRVI